jgi:hypothetical protein
VTDETWQLWTDDKEVSKAEGFKLGKEHSFLLKYTSLARTLPVELPKKDGGGTVKERKPITTQFTPHNKVLLSPETSRSHRNGHNDIAFTQQKQDFLTLLLRHVGLWFHVWPNNYQTDVWIFVKLGMSVIP